MTSPAAPSAGTEARLARPRLRTAQGSRQERGTPRAQQRPGVQRPQSQRRAEGRAASLASQPLTLGATFGPRPPTGRKRAGGWPSPSLCPEVIADLQVDRTAPSSVLRPASWGDPGAFVGAVPGSAPASPDAFRSGEGRGQPDAGQRDGGSVGTDGTGDAPALPGPRGPSPSCFGEVWSSAVFCSDSNLHLLKYFTDLLASHALFQPFSYLSNWSTT